jgi:hypothetical protein
MDHPCEPLCVLCQLRSELRLMLQENLIGWRYEPERDEAHAVDLVRQIRRVWRSMKERAW